jgi:hypothetical protein
MKMLRRPLLIAACLAAGALFGANAIAGETKGKIYSYQVDGKLLSVWVTQNAANHAGSPASCAGPANGYAIAIDSPLGQNLLTAVIIARQANLTVSVAGKGACDTIDSSKEEINSMIVWGP